jgi:cytochrome P450
MTLAFVPVAKPETVRVSSRIALLDSIAALDIPLVEREIAGRRVVFVNEPDLVREVLTVQAASFEKSEFQQRVMGMAEGSDTGLGNGMLTSSNAVNKQQRRVLGRVFSAAATERYVGDAALAARQLRDQWVDGASVELGSALMGLATRTVAKTLFSWELGDDEARVVEHLNRIGSLLGRKAEQRRAGWDDPSVIREAAAFLEQRLGALVAERRNTLAQRSPEARDVLDLLLEAQACETTAEGVTAAAAPPAGAHEKDVYAVTERQIRDEVMTLFITGSENPRNALTWTLYLLSRHPEALERIHREVDRAGVRDGELDAATLEALPFTLQVYKEALRLFPPGYAFGRRALADVKVGPLKLERETEVVISPYALHRRPSLFERATEFVPDRFKPERAKSLHAYAFLPFGAGARACIGGGFALMQGHVALAVLAGGLHFTCDSKEPLLPEPRMTLRPSGDAFVRVHHRVDA